MGVVTNPEQKGDAPERARASGTAQSDTSQSPYRAAAQDDSYDQSHDESLTAARSVLSQIFGPPSGRVFAVRFWNGVTDDAGSGMARFTLVLRNPGSLRQMLLPPSELRICQAFIHGDFDIEGDVQQAAALGEPIRERVTSPAAVARIVRTLLTLPSPGSATPASVERRDAAAIGAGSRHTPERDAHAVRSHYDVGNDFYKLWLDERMVYSCAYFESTDVDLDTAQEAKLDHICRKLRLRRGDTFLDVGCGWGGLIMHAAQRYGVTATGVTLSYEQAALARERIKAAGLESSCTVEVRDYRHLPLDASFDKIVSVGMVEHVGREQLPTYFQRLYALLKPGGLLMNHGIVHA
ncbi:MAG: class I SAM-dependent methyltransferase, partial [Gemmatimonadaceae bacterium]